MSHKSTMLAMRVHQRHPLSQHLAQQTRLHQHRVLLSLARRQSSPFFTSQQQLQSSASGQQTYFQSPQQQQQFSAPPPPPPPPQTRRSALIRIILTLFGGTTCILLGFAIGINALPSSSQITAILSTQPSDEETLTIYEPPDAASAEINTHILQHPLAKALREKTDFTESRPHLKIPPAIRDTNLTGGTLAGSGKIVVPPLQFAHKKGEEYVALFYLGPQLCGHPGIIHGGLLATLLDEGLARCCFPALPNGIGVTATLKVDYRVPVRAEKYYVLRARTEKVEGRKAWVRGWIEELGSEEEEVEKSAEGLEAKVKGVDASEGTKGEKAPRKKLVEAEGLFVEPKNAGLIKRIYTP